MHQLPGLHPAEAPAAARLARAASRPPAFPAASAHPGHSRWPAVLKPCLRTIIRRLEVHSNHHALSKETVRRTHAMLGDHASGSAVQAREEQIPEPSPPPPQPQTVPRLWDAACATVLSNTLYATEGDARSERSWRSVSSTAELDSYLDKYGGDNSDEENKGQGRKQRWRAGPPCPTGRAGPRQTEMALCVADGVKQKREYPRGIALGPQSRSVAFPAA